MSGFGDGVLGVSLVLSALVVVGNIFPIERLEYDI